MSPRADRVPLRAGDFDVLDLPMTTWTPEVARAAAQRFMASNGLHGAEARLISFRQSAIFHVPGIAASLRVYGPGEDSARAARTLLLAAYLADQAFPAMRPHPAFKDQLFDLGGLRASVWQWIEADHAAGDIGRMLGRLLRGFHELPERGAPALPPFDPVGKVRQRLQRLEMAQKIPTSDLRTLEVSLARALDMGGEMRASSLGSGLIHGDAMPGNMLVSQGQPVLIDLDSAAVGAREWDLVPMAVVAQRFDQSQHQWRQFLAGYGLAVEDVPGLEAASLIKQLTMTTYLCLSAGLSAEIDEEIRSRLRMWRDWDMRGQWRSGFKVGKAN